MVNRLGGWWQLWMVLAVIWTIVAMAGGSVNLPRARNMPHDPEFQSKLSNEAVAILLGTNATAKPVAGGLKWFEFPRMVRMSNGAWLTFPTATTDERTAIVTAEYRQLLVAEADRQKSPYFLQLLAIWLVPCACLLVAGLSTHLFMRESSPRLQWENQRHEFRYPNPLKIIGP
jgi:hypothetical protein